MSRTSSRCTIWSARSTGRGVLAGVNCRDLVTLQIVPDAPGAAGSVAARTRAASGRERCRLRRGCAPRLGRWLRSGAGWQRADAGRRPSRSRCGDAGCRAHSASAQGAHGDGHVDQDLRNDDTRGGDRGARARVDAIGFVFAESVRQLTPRRRLRAGAPARGRLACVAVTRHPSQQAIDEILAVFAPDVLQTDAVDLQHLQAPGGAAAAAGAAAACQLIRAAGAAAVRRARQRQRQTCDWSGAPAARRARSWCSPAA